MRVLACLLLAFSLTTGAAAASESDFDRAVANYLKVIRKNDFDATEEAIKAFKEVLEKNPAEHRANVYMGSLTAQLAKLAWIPWNKLRYVHRGIELMDKGVEAVDKSIKDPQVVIDSHMIRGITSARIPSAFKRGTVAAADFRLIREHPEFGRIGAVNQATVYAFSAVLAHRRDDEKAAAVFLASARSANAEVANRIWSER